MSRVRSRVEEVCNHYGSKGLERHTLPLLAGPETFTFHLFLLKNFIVLESGYLKLMPIFQLPH